MVFASKVLQVVKKTSGGRAWLPKWGFGGLTQTQKANKRKQRQDEQAVVEALKQGAASEAAGKKAELK